MKRQTVLLGINEFGEKVYDYIYPLKKRKKKKKCKNDTKENKEQNVWICSMCDGHVCVLCADKHVHKRCKCRG